MLGCGAWYGLTRFTGRRRSDSPFAISAVVAFALACFVLLAFDPMKVGYWYMD